MTRRPAAIICLLILLTSGLLLNRSLDPRTASNSRSAASPNRAQSAAQTLPNVQVISEAVEPVLTDAVRDLPEADLPSDIVLDREVNPRISWGSNPFVRFQGQPDPLLAQQAAAQSEPDPTFPTTGINADGQLYNGVNPPDPSGDVGPNHYIQMINAPSGSSVVIYDKGLNVLEGPFMLDSLGSGNCRFGLGDPIVLYDRMADRWFLSEFSVGGNQLCIYISQTADPTGSYHHYAFTATNGFPDYPKYGVWTDAYYVGTNEPSSPTVYAFDRSNMLAGTTATSQSFTLPSLSGYGFQMLVPSDHDGASAPPDGAPNYLMRHRDTEPHGDGTCPNGGSGDCLEIFEFRVDWANAANSSITLAHVVPIAEFDSDLCGYSTFSCLRQRGSSVRLDPLREIIMPTLQYRNFGTHETLVGNLVTDVAGSTNGNDQAGVRWFELRKMGNGGWTLHQEGTYAPDSHNRWMGSAALDQSGNLAIGYNAASSTLYPSLRYAGRLVNDPLGTLPQGEAIIIEGAGPNGSIRYGDYSQISVDPADDCTFWFTGQYNPSTAWSTRIATFRFEGCDANGATFSMTAASNSAEICQTDTAQFELSFDATSGFSTPVSLTTNGLNGTGSFSVNPVNTFPSTSLLTIQDAAPGTQTFNVLAASGNITSESALELTVHQALSPTVPATYSPANGAVGVGDRANFKWFASSTATSYTLQIATDPAFANVVTTATGLTTTEVTLEGLQPTTAYYWRVAATNFCGQTATTETQAFYTAPKTHWCVAPALSIPDANTNGITSTLTITDSGTLTDLNVAVQVEHAHVGDLAMTLTHVESGKTITLIENPSPNNLTCAGNDINATFDDSATADAHTTCANEPALGGDLRPNQPLSTFNGDDFSGTWHLTLSDNQAGDTGSLTSWCLAPSGEFTDASADFSDLPASYGLAAHQGNGTIKIGSDWSADASAAYSSDAADDGITLPTLTMGQSTPISVTINGATRLANGWLQAWFDWNQNGAFDSDELVINGGVTVGVNGFSITPLVTPDWVNPINYRFRLFESASEPAGPPAPFGVAQGGEVTDGTLPSSYIYFYPIVIKDGQP